MSRLRLVQTKRSQSSKLLRVVHFAELPNSASSRVRSVIRRHSAVYKLVQHKAFPVLNYLQLYDNIVVTFKVACRVNVFFFSSSLSSCLICSCSQPIPFHSYLLPVVPTVVTFFLSHSFKFPSLLSPSHKFVGLLSLS